MFVLVLLLNADAFFQYFKSPQEDMHVTIALPWWWHTIRQGNDALTKTMVGRFKQSLYIEFHYPFQIELERIILLGGKVRTVDCSSIFYVVVRNLTCLWSHPRNDLGDGGTVEMCRGS